MFYRVKDKGRYTVRKQVEIMGSKVGRKCSDKKHNSIGLCGVPLRKYSDIVTILDAGWCVSPMACNPVGL